MALKLYYSRQQIIKYRIKGVQERRSTRIGADRKGLTPDMATNQYHVKLWHGFGKNT